MRLAVARHDVPKVGICCSGGGIRAASYALGCLRALDENDVLRGPDRADHISAVSGGSYAVGAMALVQHSIEHAPRREANHAVPAPFADDSPELGRLRNHLSYLTHGPGGVVGEVWRMFLGVLMNVALLLAVAVAAGTVAGWVYGWSFPELRETCQGSSAGCSTAIHPTGWAVWGMATVGLTALTVGLLWVLRRWPRGWHRAWVATVVATTIGAVAWAVLILGMPQVLAWMHRASIPHLQDTTSGVAASISGPRVVVGGFLGVITALWATLVPVARAIRRAESNEMVKGWTAKLSRYAVTLLAAVSVPALFGGVFLWATHDAAGHPLGVGEFVFGQIAPLVIPTAYLGVVFFFGDLNSWSLHTIYRDRLSQAFEMSRPDASRPDRGLPLADLCLTNFPEVTICATSNVRNYGLAPTGNGALPFNFSSRSIGGPTVGTLDTAAYTRGGMRQSRFLTVMDAVSISGAAVSPLMGRMTRGPLRFLMALGNIRLGVWLPKPDVIEDRIGLGTPVDERTGSPVTAFAARTSGDCTRNQGTPIPPGLGYLLWEAAGTPPERARYVYVTDGGHYDNLGLSALLGERCEWIWCIDASGDHQDTFQTLAEAFAIAARRGHHHRRGPEGHGADRGGAGVRGAAVVHRHGPLPGHIDRPARRRRNDRRGQGRRPRRRSVGDPRVRRRPQGVPVRLHDEPAVHVAAVRRLPRARRVLDPRCVRTEPGGVGRAPAATPARAADGDRAHVRPGGDRGPSAEPAIDP